LAERVGESGRVIGLDRDPEMLALAEKLIEQKVTQFEPKNYEDRYETALMAMIREKLKGHKPIVAQAPERGNVINLMDALKASLGEAKPAAASKAKDAAAARKPATAPAAKPAAAKKVSLKDALAASEAVAPAKTASRRKA
jgi:DNA end-binding protein Ku